MKIPRGLVALGSASLALGGCAPTGRPPLPTAIERPPSTAGQPAPNPVRAANSGLSDAEAAWHLRSGLNVAALACDRAGRSGLAARYNRLLAHQRAPLAAAYAAESRRFGAGSALDQHVTRIYNQFAQPPLRAAYCEVANQLAAEAAQVPPDRFTAYAPKALDRLVAAFDSTLAAAGGMGTQSSGDGLPWRIQLGAYSGRRAASDAWALISRRMAGATRFSPEYQPIAGKNLVRVRIGPVKNRGEAIALCAAAAAAGLDCFPVAPAG